MTGRPVWIDLANSPHVLFFAPVIKELRDRGVPTVVTARDFAQTVPLCERLGIEARVVGRHGGASLLGKGAEVVSRAYRLLETVRRLRPQVAVSHGSYAQAFAARILGIPLLTGSDYEYQPASHLAFRCATVVAVNKVDVVRPDLGDIGGLLARKLRLRPPLLAVSALTGEGRERLLETVADLGHRYTARIATAELNRALAAIVAERPGPVKGGRRLKLYYGTQFSTAPPRIALEVNDRGLVTRDYAYYIENRLRSRFGLDGVPLVIDFKGKR